MNKFILLLLFSATITIANAQNERSVVIQKHLNTKQQYLSAYADKDSTLAYIINLWFEERKYAKQKFFALPFSLGIISASSYLIQNGNSETSSVASYGAIFGGVSLLFSIPVSLKGIKKLRTYSRKHLNQNIDLILNHKQKGNKILNNLLREKMIEGY